MNLKSQKLKLQNPYNNANQKREKNNLQDLLGGVRFSLNWNEWLLNPTCSLSVWNEALTAAVCAILWLPSWTVSDELESCNICKMLRITSSHDRLSETWFIEQWLVSLSQMLSFKLSDKKIPNSWIKFVTEWKHFFLQWDRLKKEVVNI